MTPSAGSERIGKPSFARNDQRGLFVEILNEGPWETIIHGAMNPGGELGKHYHKRTLAFFYLTSGSADVKIRNVASDERWSLVLEAGQGVYFQPYETHVIRFREPTAFVFVKSRRFSADDPDLYPAPVD